MGSFDLPSVLITVSISTILLAAGAVLAIGILPASKDDVAKDTLAAVNSAQKFAKSTDRKYLSQNDLVKRKLITPSETVLTGAGKSGGCYVALTRSETGKFFYVSSLEPDPKELLPSTNPGCDAVFTLKEAGVPDVTANLEETVDYLGGFGESGDKDPFTASYPDTVLQAGDAYKSVAPAVNGGTGSYTFTLNGTLPENVSFDASTGTFTAPDSWRPTVKPAVPSPQNGRWNFGAETVAAGTRHSCAVSAGTAYCWGANESGQLGQGSYAASAAPAAVKKAGAFENRRVTAVTAGNGFSCALEAGNVFCWGSNKSGQLGNPAVTAGSGNPADGSKDMTNVPVQVQTAGTPLEGHKVTQVSAGDQTVCAIAEESPYCWGSTVGGIRGDGITTTAKAAGEYFTAAQRKSLAEPVQVISTGALAGRKVTLIDVGSMHACAVAGSRAYCWGANTSGELGTGGNTASSVPMAVQTTTGMSGSVTDISAGGTYVSAVDDTVSTCAVSSGKVFCWGSNGGTAEGKLGIGTTDIYKKSPAPVTSPTGRTAVSVSAGQDHACAVYEDASGDGDAYCWGRGSNFSLGNNSSAGQSAPAAVQGLDGKDVSAVNAGGGHTQAVVSGGAYGWGYNTDGKTGANVPGDRPAALPVYRLGGNFGFPSRDLSVTVSDGVDEETVDVRLELR